MTKVHNALSTQANIIQFEPTPTPTPIPASPIAPPHTLYQTPQSVQQITIPEVINKTPNNTRTHQVYASFQPITGKIFTDQSGQFLSTSISGNKYLFLLNYCDVNYIDYLSMPSRTKHQILLTYKKSTEMMCKRGFIPKL